jgi:hypothetical protein
MNTNENDKEAIKKFKEALIKIAQFDEPLGVVSAEMKQIAEKVLENEQRN